MFTHVFFFASSRSYNDGFYWPNSLDCMGMWIPEISDPSERDSSCLMQGIRS